MGCGSWTRDSYVSYSTTKGMSVSTDGMIRGSYSNQDMFKARNIDSALDPKNVIRECCDTEEHPNTIPVILALDAEMVVGTARQVAVAVARLDDSLRYLDTRRYAVLFLLLNSQRRIGGDILFPRHLPLGQRIRRRAQNCGEQCQTHEQLHSHRIFR